MRIEPTPEQLRDALDATRTDPAWSASHRLAAQGKPPSEMFRALAVRPDLLGAMSALGSSVYPGGLLERPLKERVTVAVSRANRCQYCAASHSGTMARLGIESDAALSPREQAALAYAEAAHSDSNRVPDALFAALQTHFTDAEIVELTFLIGLTTLLNLFNNCLGVTYRDDYAGLGPAC